MRLLMVRLAGIEPARPYGHQILSLRRLPITPQSQKYQLVLLMSIRQLTLSFAVYVLIILHFCVCVKCFLVLLTRIELVFLLYHSSVLPCNYRSKLAGLAGIEPTTFVSKTKMISVSPKTDGTPGQIRTVTILLLRETPHTNWATGVFIWSLQRESNPY